MLLLVIFLTAAGLFDDRRQANFYLTLALAPLIRIVSLSMPLGQLPQAFWYVLTAVPVLVAATAVARRTGLSFADVGLRLPNGSSLPWEASVVVLGPLLGAVEWQILHVKPIVDGSSLALAIGAGLILLVFTGFFEEFVFRGLFQRVAGRLLGPAGGVLCTAVLFAILHTGWRSAYDMLFVLCIALYFGYVVLRTGSILGVTLSHGAINIMLFIVLPLTLVPAVHASFEGSGRPVARVSAGRSSIASGTLIRLVWRNVPLAGTYELQVGESPGRRGTYVSRSLRVHRNSARLRVTGRQWYFWRVRASILGMWQPYSGLQRVLVARPQAHAPTGLSASFVKRTGPAVDAKLCWRPVKNATGYRVDVASRITAPPTRNCLALRLATGHRYAWRVAAVVKGVHLYSGLFSHPHMLTIPATQRHYRTRRAR